MKELNDYVQALLKNFVNQELFDKKIALLTKKIREILDIISRLGGNSNEDDAMFTKRPYGPVSCASCQKNIVNLQGIAQQHLSWNKLPFKDPSKRLADYGAGFSKMLQNVKPEGEHSFHHHHNSQSF